MAHVNALQPMSLERLSKVAIGDEIDDQDFSATFLPEEYDQQVYPPVKD